jgi:hypothetical protein
MPGIVKEGPIRHFRSRYILADWSPLTCNNASPPPMVPNPNFPLSGRRIDRYGSQRADSVRMCPGADIIRGCRHFRVVPGVDIAPTST